MKASGCRSRATRFPRSRSPLIRKWIEEGAKYDAEDPKADLASIVPPPVHPDPPEAYPQTLPVTALEFSADGSQLFAGGYHEITVWNPADGQLVRRIKNVDQRTYGLRSQSRGEAAGSGVRLARAAGRDTLVQRRERRAGQGIGDDRRTSPSTRSSRPTASGWPPAPPTAWSACTTWRAARRS
jgi:hypothetical protein